MEYETLADFRTARQLGKTNAELGITVDSAEAYEDNGEGECVLNTDPWTLLSEALDLLGIPYSFL